MSIKLEKINWESLTDWLDLNIESQLKGVDLDEQDRNLLLDIKGRLKHIVEILEKTCRSYDIHTKDGIRLYISIISSMSTFYVLEDIFKQFESSNKTLEECIMGYLKLMSMKDNPPREKINELNIKLGELIGPGIKWWIEKTLGVKADIKDLLKEAIDEMLKNEFKDDSE